MDLQEKRNRAQEKLFDRLDALENASSEKQQVHDENEGSAHVGVLVELCFHHLLLLGRGVFKSVEYVP